MFCKNCGQQIPDNAGFCEYCGQPVNMEVNYESVQPMQGDDNSQQQYMQSDQNYQQYAQPVQPPRKAKRFNKKIIAAALAVVVVIVALKSCMGDKYTTPLNNIAKIMNKQQTDIDKIVDSAVPGFVADSYHDAVKIIKGNKEYKDGVKDFYEDLPDVIQDWYDEVFDMWEDEYGKNVKISYKIKDKEKLDKDERESIAKAYASFADLSSGLTSCIEALEDCTELEEKEIDKLVGIVEKLEKKLEKIKVSSGYLLSVDLKIKGKEDDDSEKMDVVVIKVDGDWTIDYLSTMVINETDEYDLDEMDDFVDERMDLKELNTELKAAKIYLKDMDEDVLEYILDNWEDEF